MPIDVQAPDGSIARFPDGTSDAIIEKAMSDTWGSPKQSGLAANAKAGFIGMFSALPDQVQAWARKTIPGAATAMDLAKGIADAALGKSPAFVKLAKDAGKTPEAYAQELQGQLHEKHINESLPDNLNPENVTATTTGERIARGAGAGLASVFLPAGELNVANVLKNAAIGTGAGAGGAVAAEAAPEPLKPAANVIGAILGGLATHGAMKAPGAVLDAAKPFAEPFAAAVNPDAAATAAARRLDAAASDPAAVRASLEQPGELVPGSQPTTFQQTGDLGLGGLERGVATRNPEAFAARRADQNTARVGALSEIQQGADPNDVAKALKTNFDVLEKQTQAAVDAATTEAQAKAAALGPEVTPEATGAAVRQAVSEAETAARAKERGLWQAVDPNGDLVGNVRKTTDEANTIASEMGPAAKPMEGEEAAIFDVAAHLQPLAPVRDLIDLRSRVSTEMRNELIANGRSPAYARLTRLRGAIQDNLAHTISERVANEEAAIGRGDMAPEASTLARIQKWTDQWLEDAGAGRSGAVAGDQAHTGAPAVGVRGVDGTGREARGGPAGTARDQGLSAELGSAKADVDLWKAGQSGSISQAIKELGGIKLKDEAGAVLAGPDIVGSLVDIKAPGVVNKAGLSPERMAQALADRGWFGEKPADPSAAFEAALAREAMGAKVFHPQTYEPGFKQRLAQLDREISEAGVQAADRPNDAARKLASYRASAADLRRRAEAFGIDPHRPIADVAGDLAEREAIQADAPPERDAHGEEFDRRVAEARGNSPTFDDAAKGRLDEATQATKERAQTFGVQPIKGVLQTIGTKDQFRLSDGGVPAKFFHPGNSGFDDLTALLKAQPDALPLIQDYAATSLRRAAADTSGVVDPKKFGAWRKAHDPAIRALPPETRARFTDAAKAGTAVADALASRADALKQAQSGALGKVMKLENAEDVTKTVGQLLNGRTAVQDIKDLLRATSGNPVARQGLRQAVADFMTQKLIGNTEAAASGVKQIKADAYLTFIKDKRAALNLVFKPAEVKTMEAIGEDIARAKRSENAVKLPGGSNTAQDAIAAKKGGLMEKGGRTFLDAIAGAAGWHFGGPIGTVIAAGGAHLLQSMRASGIARIDQLLTEAMLHPEVARELLKKAPLTPNTTKPLAAALRTAQRSAWAAVQADNAKDKHP